MEDSIKSLGVSVAVGEVGGMSCCGVTGCLSCRGKQSTSNPRCADCLVLVFCCCGFLRCLYGVMRVGRERKRKPLLLLGRVLSYQRLLVLSIEEAISIIIIVGAVIFKIIVGVILFYYNF